MLINLGDIIIYYPKIMIYSHYVKSVHIPYPFVFSPNAGKCGPEYLRIRTLFMTSALQRV